MKIDTVARNKCYYRFLLVGITFHASLSLGEIMLEELKQIHLVFNKLFIGCSLPSDRAGLKCIWAVYTIKSMH